VFQAEQKRTIVLNCARNYTIEAGSYSIILDNTPGGGSEWKIILIEP
jgi:hypothetical protein